MPASRRFFVLVSLSCALGCAPALMACGLEGGPGDYLDDSEAALTAVETFESGTKGSYAAADVTLSTGVWNLDDALIGTSSSDAKVGTRSARIRNSGTVTMRFDRASVGTVAVKYATYGSDASGTFGAFVSTDGGSTWSQAGATVTSHALPMTTATFDVDRSGGVRIQLRKLDGGSGRINLDDVTITDSGTQPPPPDAGVPVPTPDAGPGPNPGPGHGGDISAHLMMGVPSAASTAKWDDYLSVKSQYVVAYNSTRKTANWVSWQLDSSYIGSTDRTNSFRVDDTLPSGMPQATLADYSGSGYDRGHMCPSGDRTASTEANRQTFYMTNMLPQATNNNTGPWEKLETYSRSLVSGGKVLYVTSGGTWATNPPRIGNGVAVPSNTWKVIVVLDSRSQGPGSVTASTRVIGVMMPNDDSLIRGTDTWQRYRVSVRSIEKATKLNFLSDVAPSIQDAVEMRTDNQ